MSHDFPCNTVQYSHNNRRPSGVCWLGPLAFAVSLLSGCASGGGTNTANPVASAGEPDPPAVEQPIDQSPIAVKPTNNDIATNPNTPINDADKESDMTVLVLDNPELMAKAAQIDAMDSQVDTMDESPRKPHRLKFHFGFNKHRLSEEDHDILLGHAAYLKAHPEVAIQINGHTDNHGADEYNDFLSRLRAKTAAKVLQQAGVDTSQIEIRGWGSQKPLTNPQDHAANRRLELQYQSEQMAKAQ